MVEERPFIRGRGGGKGTKRTGVTTLTFQGHVTSWIRTSGDRSIRQMPFPIGGLLEPSTYRQ